MLQRVIVLLFLLIRCQVVSCDDESLDCVPRKFKSIKDEFVSSFLSFKDKVENFFSVSLDKLERRRIKLKKAFHNFIGEAIADLEKRHLMQLVRGTEEIMTAPQMIAAHGHKVQSYTILTEDGFLLTLHRVVSSNLETTSSSKIVLLHHGLFGSSDDWLLLGKNKALPYLLLAAGYDVWLANARGNKYSNIHINKTVDTSSFWDFSWHEIGLYDLSAIIDYFIAMTSNDTEIHFIGHSSGATSLLVLLSISPQYNRIFKSATFLAPLVFMYKVEGPLRTLADYYKIYTKDNYLKPTFLPSEKMSSKMLERFCKGDVKLCLNPLLLLTNGGQDFFASNITKAVLSHVPSGGSKKILVHYLQLVRSGDFHMFDYGSRLNAQKYGKRVPPRYDLNKVTVPISIFSSSSDWLSTVPDIVNLLNKLRTVLIHHVVRNNGFSHTDFLWSNNAPELVYYLILDVLQHLGRKTALKGNDTKL